MIPRRSRLTREAFPKGRGKSVPGTHFSLVYGPSNTGGCAAVVSKKVAKRSVDRHLLKRRMLSVMRPWCSSKQYLVAYAKAGSTTLPFRDITTELTHLINRAR